MNNNHCLCEFQEVDNRNRTIRRVCKHCSNIKAYPGNKAMKRTMMFCNKCEVPLHAQCFTVYHSANHIPIIANQVDINAVTSTPIAPNTSSTRSSSNKRRRMS